MLAGLSTSIRSACSHRNTYVAIFSKELVKVCDGDAVRDTAHPHARGHGSAGACVLKKVVCEPSETNQQSIQKRTQRGMRKKGWEKPKPLLKQGKD